jgi:hypothetical protein
MLGTKRKQFGNIVGHVSGVADMSSLSAWTATQFDPALNWGDVEWIKKRWGGKLILKGIQDVEDAKLSVASGADALIVSNHGGRQLDGAQSSIEALPTIVDAVGSQIEVHMDGGIRSGQDVLKARALGARGVYIGRPFLYGLGAMGMTAGGFHAPVFTVAWPSGEFGAMGLEGAVRLGYRKELAALPEGAQRQALFEELLARQVDNGSAIQMATTLEIDAVIDPADTRHWLAQGLVSARKETSAPSRFIDTW